MFWANLVVTFAVVSSAAALFALCSPWLLTLFGEQFTAGRKVMLILLMATLPEAIALATVQTIQSQERMWLILFCRVIPCYATLLGLGLWLIPGLGAVGLAWAYLAAWSLALLADVTIIGRIGVWEDREPASA